MRSNGAKISVIREEMIHEEFNEMTDVSMLDSLLQESEDEHLEFKEAKTSFEFEELVKYCAALANERGGKIMLGVTNARPHRVVDSHAFITLERTKLGLMERLHLRIEANEIHHAGGRVVVFDVPSRPLGFPIQYKGAYWMRAGESLVPMTADQLKRIFSETGPDFSAEVCTSALMEDLDPRAIRSLTGAMAQEIRKSRHRVAITGAIINGLRADS